MRIATLRHLTGWRAWASRLATAILVPAFLPALVEGSLRLLGCGYPTAFCLKQNGSYIENGKFLWQFYSRKTNLRPNPFEVAATKPADGLRAVVIGESAAAGTPQPAYNFGRILDRMLRQRFPGRHLEVINAAMRGVNSHILLPAARDCCVKLRPDVVIVYMGNNEVVGLYAPGPHSGRLTSFLHLLQATSFPPFTGQIDHARRQAAAQLRHQRRFGSLTAQDLEAASATYLAALRQFPDDWLLSCDFAKLRFLAHDYAGAIQQFEAAQARMPHWISIRLGLSAALLSAGRAADALRTLHERRAARLACPPKSFCAPGRRDALPYVHGPNARAQLVGALHELEALHPESEEVKAGIMAAQGRGRTL